MAKGRGTLVAALAAGLITFLCWTPRASALEFCLPGSGAGQCASPIGINELRGLAVDYKTGRLYVADRNNNRVDVFKEDGTFLFAFGWGVDTGAATLQTCTTASTCQAGTPGSGAGQLNAPGRIAVDNDPTSPTQHAVYVAEDSCWRPPLTTECAAPPNFRVQKFDATGAFLGAVGSSGEGEGQFTSGILPGVGPGGVLYVLDNPPDVAQNTFKHRLQRFEPNGTPIAPQCFASEGIVKGKATGLAVEAGGDFWVANENDARAIRKYDASCTPLLSPPGKEVDPGIEIYFLTRDEAGDLFAQQGIPKDKALGRYQVITTYDTSGNYLRRFGYDEILDKPEGLAAGAAGTFVSVGNAGIKLIVEPPPGPIIAPSSVEASPVRSVWAAIGTEINPEGKATKYKVEWVDKASFEATGFANAKSGGELELSASDFSIHAIEAAIAGCKPFSPQALSEGKCLQPETEYRFRIKAKNADGEDEVEGEFKTLKPVEIEALYASGVGTDTATLNAEVDPLGSEATGSFQYIDEAGYQAGIEAAEEEGKSRQEAEEEGRGFDHALEIPDVEGGAAPILFGAGEGAVRRGASLYPLAPGTTYRYRLIAEDPFATLSSEAKAFTTLKPQPPETGGCPNEAFRSGASALLPDCRAYELVSPLDKGGADIRVLETNGSDPAVLEQSAESGDRLAFGSVRAFGDATSAPWTSQYIAQRVEGAEWRTHSINSPRRGKGFNPIAEGDTEFKFFSPDLCDAWQIPYDTETPLGEGAQEGFPGFLNLYRRSDRLCGPEGYEALAPLAKPKGLPKGGGLVMELMGVSGDGAHAIFRTNGELTKEGTGGVFQLYESVRGAGLRFICVLPGGGATSKACTAGSGPRAETRGANVAGAISQDGERIYWSESDVGEGKLYVRIGGAQTLAVSEDAEAQAGTSGSFFWGASRDGSRAIFTTGGRLYEFTPAGKGTQLLAEGVIGVMGMSEDASRIYFASSKVLPKSGQNREGAEASEGEPNLYLYEEAEGGGVTSFIATLAAGDLSTQHAAPLSSQPGSRSSRVSPDGEHAAFTSLARLTGYDNSDAEGGKAAKEVYLYDAATGRLRCASCNPSGARPVAVVTENVPFAARIPGFETQMHAARVLSNDGTRLYFESADELAPADSNGAVDVYQWEAPGAGTCTTSSPSFSSQDEGCISLISSGQSPIDSRFVEASPDERDVFFASLSSLLPQDSGLIDIYDARAGGGLPTPPPEAPPCEGDSCHNPPASPVQPTPSSSSYTGPKEGKKKTPRKGCQGGKKAKKSAKGKRHCAPKHKKHHRGAAR